MAEIALAGAAGPGGDDARTAAMALARALVEEGRADEAATVLQRLARVADGITPLTLEPRRRLEGLEPTPPVEALGQAADTVGGLAPSHHAVLQARGAERRGRPDQALELWRDALARDPVRAEARLGLIRCLRRDGRYVEAEASCSVLLAASPGERAALLEYARIADDADDPAGAEPRWLEAIVAGCGPAARIGWAVCLGRQHRFEEARAIISGLVVAQPEVGQAMLARGRVALLEGDHAAAEADFQRVLAARPRSLPAALGLGRVLELRHRFAEASAHLAMLAETYPDAPEVHLARARLAAQQADLDLARSAYDVALALDPLRAEAWLGLASALSQLGEHMDAARTIDEAADLWPRHPALLTARARILEESGDDAAAHLALLAARSTLPHRAEPFMALAEFALRGGSVAAAREHVEAALATHGRSLTVALLAIDLRLAAGDLASARELLDPLAARLPEHREVLKRAARLDVVEGRLEEARRRWRRIARHNIRISGPPEPLERCDAWPIPEGADELRAFIVERNERRRLAWLLDYYRRLGVDRFFVLDNGSDDGTFEWLQHQPPDLHLFRTSTSYAAAGYGMRWLHDLLDRWGDGRWCLTVDADEALVYPHAERLTLKRLTGHLDRRGAEALLAPMLDMYAVEPLGRTSYEPGQSLIERFPWFDAAPYAEEDVPEFPFRRLTGGPRQRCLAGRDRLAAQMEKIPLVRWSRSVRYLSSTHQIYPVRLAAETGLLLHFKYLPDFADAVHREVERAQHSMGARRYRRYLDELTRIGDVTFHHAGSVSYRDSLQLVELGLMRSSPELDALARSSR